MFDKRAYWLAAIAGLLMASGFGGGPSFVPDTSFKGSNLSGWHVLGQADWHTQNGEIIGAAKAGAGWLVLDRSYQDVAFYTTFQCSGGCRTGVLLRAEKTAAGMKGIFVSLNEGDVASYRVTLDAQGKETSAKNCATRAGRIALPRRPIRPPRGAAARALWPAAEAAERCRPESHCLSRRPRLACTPADGTASRSCSTPTSCVPSSTMQGRPPAALPTMMRAVTARWRSTSAGPAKCTSKAWPTKTLV